MVTQQIRKAGNSYVVTIPKSEMDRLELSEGDYVSMDLGKMELKPVLNPELQAYEARNLEALTEMMMYLKDK